MSASELYGQFPEQPSSETKPVSREAGSDAKLSPEDVRKGLIMYACRIALWVCIFASAFSACSNREDGKQQKENPAKWKKLEDLR